MYGERIQHFPTTLKCKGILLDHVNVKRIRILIALDMACNVMYSFHPFYYKILLQLTARCPNIQLVDTCLYYNDIPIVMNFFIT